VKSTFGRSQLKKLGYYADAVSRKEVLNAAPVFLTTLFLMDCQMPEMDGYEVSRAIRRSARSRPYIILLTATRTFANRERACRPD